MNGNAVIALFLALGLILHWNPIRYVRTFTGILCGPSCPVVGLPLLDRGPDS